MHHSSNGGSLEIMSEFLLRTMNPAIYYAIVIWGGGHALVYFKSRPNMKLG